MAATETEQEAKRAECRAALIELATLARGIAERLDRSGFDDLTTDGLIELVRGAAAVLDAADAERRGSRANALAAAAQAGRSIADSEAA